MTNGPVVSIDADVFRYRIGYASQEVRYKVKIKGQEEISFFDKKGDVTSLIKELGEDNVSYQRQVKPSPVQNALHSMKLQINSVINAVGSDRIRIILSGTDNFRINRATFCPYKGSRTYGEARQALLDNPKWTHYFASRNVPEGQPKPKLYPQLTEYLEKIWDAHVVDGMEADDELTIRQTKAWNWSQDKDKLLHKGHIVATIDKDLQQVPGWYFDFRPDDQRAADRPAWKFVTPEEADRNLWAQVITGDMTDDIYGVEGMGPAKANKAIGTDPKKYKDNVLNTYKTWFRFMDSSEERTPMQEFLLNNYTYDEYMQEVYDLIYLLRDRSELDAKTVQKA